MCMCVFMQAQRCACPCPDVLMFSMSLSLSINVSVHTCLLAYSRECDHVHDEAQGLSGGSKEEIIGDSMWRVTSCAQQQARLLTSRR